MLPGVTAYMAGKHRVQVATLFKFDFLSSTKRFWDGTRNLVTSDGAVWQASGKVIGVTGLEQSRGLTAPPTTFTLTGADAELMAYAASAEYEITNRPCSVYIQFLSDRLIPLDYPIAIWAGRMDTLTLNAQVKTQIITLTAEQFFVTRIRTPYGFMTDTDQQARWPGDKGMEFMPTLRNKKTRWLLA